jgi:trehalose-phosphatase
MRLVAPFREAPAESAALFDVDGTLAPIVGDPGDSAVPAETSAALRELAARFALVGCVSGRRAADARRLVGVEELVYVGNHGLELLAPGEEEAELDPVVAPNPLAAREFVGGLGALPGGAGLRVEDKGPIQALHWRGAPDEREAELQAQGIAEGARGAGLEPRFGRKVLELWPVAGIDKGTAVRRLLGRPDLGLALFAGDDRTDLDAFRALRALVAEGELRATVCIGIASDEAPPELLREADAVLRGPGELVDLLRSLAAPESSASRATG